MAAVLSMWTQERQHVQERSVWWFLVGAESQKRRLETARERAIFAG